MMQRILIPVAWLAAVIATVGFVGTDGSRATEMRVISSDANAGVVPVELSKAVVIELSTDVKDVLVSDPTVANAVVLSPRRISILGKSVGQSNIFLYTANGTEIAALDVWVTSFPPPNAAWRKNAVVIFRNGIGWRHLNCSPEFQGECLLPERQDATDTWLDAGIAGAAAGAAAGAVAGALGGK
jgi:hypothetical protein